MLFLPNNNLRNPFPAPSIAAFLPFIMNHANYLFQRNKTTL
jgi:hypothetical protein